MNTKKLQRLSTLCYIVAGDLTEGIPKNTPDLQYNQKFLLAETWSKLAKHFQKLSTE